MYAGLHLFRNRVKKKESKPELFISNVTFNDILLFYDDYSKPGFRYQETGLIVFYQNKARVR